MTTLEELLGVHDRLTVVHVERWVARGLLRPAADGENWIFEPVDVARARLLETVVDLLDQVHTLRRQLHQLGLAIGRQPTTTRESIAVALKDLSDR
jgi:chaperone modulatory protein CbpM